MTGPDDDPVKAAAAIGAAHYRPGALARVDAYFDQVKAQRQAARAMLAALERSLHLIEKADADSGCLAYTEIAAQHRAAIAAAKAADIKAEGE